MKRPVFRLTITILTFLFGVAATKFLSLHLFQPTTFKVATQALTIPELKQPSATPVSNKVQRIGDLPATGKFDFGYSIQFINEREGWVALDERLWRTRDGGENWSLIFDAGYQQPISGSNFTEPKSICEFQFINAETGWVLLFGEFYKTEDGGQSWKRCGQSALSQFAYSPSTFKFLNDGKHGWMAGGVYRTLGKDEAVSNRFYSFDGKQGQFGAIFYTEDGGKTWRRQLLAEGSGQIEQLSFLDAEHGWAIGTSGAFYLKNGRWKETDTRAWDAEGHVIVGSLDVEIGAPTYAPIGVHFVTPELGWLSNSDGWMAKSTDGGRTWQDVLSFRDYQEGRAEPLLSVSNLFFSDSMNGWGLDSSGALRQTSDGGTTWTKIETGTEFLDLFFLDAQHGWAVSKDGLFRIIPTRLSNTFETAQRVSSSDVDYYAHLKPEHSVVVQQWLKTKPYLRPAREELDDYIFQEEAKSDFEGNLKFLRDSLGKNNYQYYAVGDMNHDGREDFALLLVDTRKQQDDDDHFALAIFNAPFKKGNAPAYYEDGLQGISNSYIVFNETSRRHLFLGVLESDVLCATYYSKGKTYYFKDCLE